MKVKPPINALAQYLMALAAVIGCYSLYIRHAVPIIEGPPNLIQRPKYTPLAELPSPREEKSHLVPFLPIDSWELSDCKTLLTESGTILFKDFEEQPDGSLQVMPFTLFSGLEDPSKALEPNLDSPSSPPTVLRCIDGANLKFDKPIAEVFSGDGSAKLNTARLTGNVDIYRPPTDPTANDALHIMTSNVQVDKQRIYTLDNVQFVFGPNKASGRNLLIDLAHEESPLGADFSNISGVKRLELAFLHKLRIEPVGSNSMVLGNGSPNKPKLFSNQKSPIEVSCSGPFVFDFDKNVASFEQEVVAQQMDNFQDSIQCDKLTLKFKEKEPTLDPAPQTDQLFNEQTTATNSLQEKALGDLELTSFLAQGSPAVVVSHSSAAKVTGEFLSYDVDTSEIAARCSPQTDQVVSIVSDEFQMVSQEIRYVVPEDKSLGEVNAMGSGRMLQLKTEDRDEFFVSWSKSLTTRNDPQRNGLKRILLQGDTSVRIADETQTNADQMEVLVWQVPSASPAPDADKAQKWDYQPFQIVAQGNVSIISPKLSGFSQKMTATWPRRTAGAVRTQAQILRPQHRVGYRGRLQTQDGADGYQNSRADFSVPWRAPSSRATATPTTIPPAKPFPHSDFVELATFDESEPSVLNRADLNIETVNDSDAGETKTIEFRGRDVQVRLQESQVNSKKQTQIVDLTVVGDVRVLQRSLPSPTSTQSANREEQPLVIKGDQLRLTPQGDKTYRAVVSSKPLANQPEYPNQTSSNQKKSASISAKGFELFGSDINLDQKANKLWVEGSGSMKINPDSVRDATQKQSEKPLTTAVKNAVPQYLDVTWKGGMIFDGRKIYFERNVVMAASQIGKPTENGANGGRHQIKSSSEGLSVELEEPINFSDLTSDAKPDDPAAADAKIRELIFVSQIPKSKRAFQLAAHNSASKTADKKTPYVVVENRTFDGSGTLTQKQNIIVPNVTFNVQAGGIFAKGPGTIATHRLGSGRLDGTNPLANLGSRDSRTTDKKKQSLSFIQVNFDGEMNINPDQKEMTVVGNVRTIYAPIGSWKQTFDPDNRKKKAPPGSVNLRCDQLQLAQWASRSDNKSFNEMLATGNTHLYSDEFEATANRVSYSQASDVLVVEGTPRTDANLWFKQTPNDKNPTHLIAEKISYRISDQRTQIQSVKNMNINSK